MDLPFAGQWRFSLRVDEGGRITVLDEQEMTVEDGLESAVAFRVERTVFEGRALVQGRPEFGSLTLVRQGPLGQVAAQTSVDADGHFKVRLPTAGKYQAAFRSGLTSTVHFSTDAEFIAGRPTTVDFRDVVLQGMVVRRDGVPASGAIVRATPAQFAEAMMAASLPTSTKTDDRGQFAFRVPPGTWVVRAALNALVASPLTVEVPASGAPPPLRIVLETTAPIRGRVVDAGGAPIPQAVGRVTLETSGDAQLSQSSLLQTDLDGYFTVDLDRPNPRGVQIVIASPGRPLTAFRLPSLPEEAPVLVVPATGAPVRLTLPLDSPVNANEPPPYRVYGLVNDQGAALTVVDILVFAKGSAVAAENAVTISVPAVAPGTWRLVKFRDDRDYDLWLAGLSPLNVLRTFSVSSAAPVVIDLTIR